MSTKIPFTKSGSVRNANHVFIGYSDTYSRFSRKENGARIEFGNQIRQSRLRFVGAVQAFLDDSHVTFTTTIALSNAVQRCQSESIESHLK